MNVDCNTVSEIIVTDYKVTFHISLSIATFLSFSVFFIFWRSLNGSLWIVFTVVHIFSTTCLVRTPLHELHINAAAITPDLSVTSGNVTCLESAQH